MDTRKKVNFFVDLYDAQINGIVLVHMFTYSFFIIFSKKLVVTLPSKNVG